MSPEERARFDALRRKERVSAEIVKMLDRHGLVDALLNGERITLVLPGGVVADIRVRRGSVYRSSDAVRWVPDAAND
jgi:hypothetical protein